MPYKPANSPYWYSSITVGCRQIRRSTKTTSRKEAEQIEKQWLIEAQSQTNKWEDVMAEYLEGRYTERANYAIQAMRPYFEGMVAQHITPAVINGYKKFRKSKGVADSTIHKELTVMRAAYRYGKHELGLDLPIDLMQGRLPKIKQSGPRWLSREEFNRLVKAAESNNYSKFWLPDFIRLAVATGLRNGELLALVWGRVDIDQRLIYLQPEDQKGARFSSVPINDDAAEIFKRRKQYAGNTVIARKSGAELSSVKKSFKRAALEANLPDVRIHDLRHTCAAWLVQAGVPIRTVAEVLRHKDITTTLIYAHLSPEHTREAVAMLKVS
jgi:integrase